MKSLLREPLIHFLLIGAALFLVFEVFDDPAGPQSSRIVITNGQIEYLKASFARTRQHSPTEQELQGLIEGYVREEIFYREALALGLDKDDTVVRRRLRQKLELMSDDLAGITTPSDDQLQQFLETNSDKFRTEPQIAFRHVFLDIAKRGNSALDEAARLLAVLSDEGSESNPDTLGDRLMLPKTFHLTHVSEIAKLFGESFSLELINRKPEQWIGPVQSGYGLHLVLVTGHVAGRLPRLDEIRETVEWEWTAANRKELKENIYNELREKYTVVFEQQSDGANTIQAVSEAQAAQENQQ
ncbi:MAG: peptidyl-prolyl cis-trans isomerase [Deltaproteobacteria bacterium]|nr:peptidyl-prolyl cis-trans isomerase [Deltaproteobacteria bacterium]